MAEPDPWKVARMTDDPDTFASILDEACREAGLPTPDQMIRLIVRSA